MAKTAIQRRVRNAYKFDGKFPEVAALRGRRVKYWGQEWTCLGANYLGDMELVRTEERPDGNYLIGTSGRLGLEPGHPHFLELI